MSPDDAASNPPIVPSLPVVPIVPIVPIAPIVPAVPAVPSRPPAGPTPSWTAARLTTGVLHRARNEFVSSDGGLAVTLEPRVMGLLAYLIEQRHRAVGKDELLRVGWGEDRPDAGNAVVRTVMKARHAIGDIDRDPPLIRTVHRLGYHFVGEVTFELEPAPGESGDDESGDAATAPRRLALLPLSNRTGDDTYAWVELGLTSMVAKGLRALPTLSLVPLEDTLAAIGDLAQRGSLRVQASAVDDTLAPRFCAWGELQGATGWLQLHVGLRERDGAERQATFAGANAATLASDMARQLRQWLVDGPVPAAAAHIDLGDAFRNELYARALQRSREHRFIEARHLFDAIEVEPVDDASVLGEVAGVLVALGDPDAADALARFRVRARDSGDTALQAVSLSLEAVHFEQSGRLESAIDCSLSAVELVRPRGLDDEAVRALTLCARRMAMGADERAAAVVSEAVPAAERLGNRVLLCEAYCTAAQVAGFRNDWVAALRYQSAAVSIAGSLHAASRSLAHGGLSWIQGSLGQLDAALASAETAFDTARLSGAVPQLGLAAGQAALACLHKGRLARLASLHAQLESITHDHSVAMETAREVYCRSTLLAIAGQLDAAQDALTPVLDASQGHPRLRSRCWSWQLTLLLLSGRYDELRDACERLERSMHAAAEGHLRPQIARMRAFADLYEHGDRAWALLQLTQALVDLPLSEMHARISLEAAWLYLEAGQPRAVARLIAPLDGWMQESPGGRLVAARVQLARGDARGALRTQQQFLLDYPDIHHPAHFALLDHYRACALGEHPAAPQTIDRPLTLLFGLAPTLRHQWPARLGGERADRSPALAPVRP